jgi:hypothetical protein
MISDALPTNIAKLAAPIVQQKTSEPATAPIVDPETRRRLIEVAAYLRAERRGFAGGCPVSDWLEAEREVDGAQ